MAKPFSTPLVERIVAFLLPPAGTVTAGRLRLALGASFYTATHFAMNTDSGKLISADVGWRKREINFDHLFPQQSDLILVVIDGATPELAEAAAAALPPGICARTRACSLTCSRPDGGPFFDHNGMLFLPLGRRAGHHPAIVQGPALSGRAGRRSLPARRDGQSFHRASGRRPRPGQTVRSGYADGALRPQSSPPPPRARRDYLSWRSLITGQRRQARGNPPLHRSAAEAGFRRAGTGRARQQRHPRRRARNWD